MQRIVVDTNVFVSSIIQRGIPYQIINEIFLEVKAELCISGEVLEEYYQVLHRNKFSRYPDFLLKAELLLADIEEKSKIFEVNQECK
ncbi:MAG: putative toxin-antitoxin system toxin component, PIN family [Chitinophagales bacterium]|nr:putative toxin-antitoxin system toxin component, PIN family [Chitinophagales bacterium]